MCGILGIGNTTKALQKLERDEMADVLLSSAGLNSSKAKNDSSDLHRKEYRIIYEGREQRGEKVNKEPCSKLQGIIITANKYTNYFSFMI